MVAETSPVSGLAGRYATALFELGLEQKALDEIAADLAAIKSMIADSEDLRRLLRSPILTRDQQLGALQAIFAAAGIGNFTGRFVGTVANNRRLFALDQMIDVFDRLLAEHRGEITAQVASAKPLSEDQVSALGGSLAEIMGQEVKLDTTVDSGLVGGLVVRVGSRMFDSSIRTKLQKLELAMKGVA